MLAEVRGRPAEALDRYDRSAEVSLGQAGRLVNHGMLLVLHERYEQVRENRDLSDVHNRSSAGRGRVTARLLASPPPRVPRSVSGTVLEESSGRRLDADAMLKKYETFLAARLTRAVEADDAFDSRGFARRDGVLPEEWAGGVIATLRRRAVENPLGVSAVPKACAVLAELAQQDGAAHRKAGRLDDARRIAGRLFALARELVRELPNRPESYLVLSVAHEQAAKNAWQVGDTGALLGSRVKSVDAARDALRHDPASEDARRQLDVWERRLAADRAKYSDRTPAS